jgi:predicted metalloendopeptidase
MMCKRSLNVICEQVKSMMDDMRLAFRKEVESLSWIDEKTKLNVYEKVHKINSFKRYLKNEKRTIRKTPSLCVKYSSMK